MPQISAGVTLALGRFLCAGLFSSGLNSAFRFLFERDHVLVLMYHRVIDPRCLNDSDAQFLDPGIYVTDQDFEMHMEYISRHYHVIDAAHLARAVRNGDKLGRFTCVITFDDGWKDNYTYAFPVLKKYDLPATVFLVSEYVGTNRWYWQNKVSVLLSRLLASGGMQGSCAATCATMERTGLSPLLSHPHLPPSVRITRFLRAMKTLVLRDIDRVIQELEEALRSRHIGIDYSERLILNWEEAMEMSRHGITFGSHTRTHPILTKIPIGEAIEEIAQSKITIEAHLHARCTSFCYPNGDYDNEVKENVMAHYEYAFSTHPGLVRPHDDPYALKRVGVRHATSCTLALFACQTSGIVPFVMSAMGKLRHKT